MTTRWLRQLADAYTISPITGQHVPTLREMLAHDQRAYCVLQRRQRTAALIFVTFLALFGRWWLDAPRGWPAFIDGLGFGYFLNVLWRTLRAERESAAQILAITEIERVLNAPNDPYSMLVVSNLESAYARFLASQMEP